MFNLSNKIIFRVLTFSFFLAAIHQTISWKQGQLSGILIFFAMWLSISVIIIMGPTFLKLCYYICKNSINIILDHYKKQ